MLSLIFLSSASSAFSHGRDCTGGVRVLNRSHKRINFPESVIDEVASRQQKELERRECLYSGSSAFARCSRRTVMLTDDGLATGATMRAAATALRQ